MRLYEYIKSQPKGAEIPVHDENYDIEIYFYNDDCTSNWQAAMMIIARHLTVLSENTDGVTVDLSNVIFRNINNGKFENLFIRNNVDAIMYDIENIFAGCVSDNWLSEFADSLI